MILYIGALSSIIVCLLAWCLNLLGKLGEQQLQDSKKINRVVFNLLELKFWVEKELALEAQLTPLLDRYVKDLASNQIALTEQFISQMRSVVSAQVKHLLSEGGEIPEIEGKLDEIVSELAEVDPIFAFVLKDKYKLTPHILRARQLITGLAGADNPEIQAQVINGLMRPRILADLGQELDQNLPALAKKAGRKTYRGYKKLVLQQPVPIDAEKLNAFMEGYVRDLLLLSAQTIQA
jgi:hypothetical protein